VPPLLLKKLRPRDLVLMLRVTHVVPPPVSADLTPPRRATGCPEGGQEYRGNGTG
jgi:hypothetical protein